jgi:DUF2934 family protein
VFHLKLEHLREKPSVKKTARNEARPKDEGRAKNPPKKPAAAMPVQTELADSIFRERVAQKAYDLFQRRGGEPGHEMEDWLEAERIVRAEMSEGSNAIRPGKIKIKKNTL